jgi:membrane protease YdiL (CAAX protease family)
LRLFSLPRFIEDTIVGPLAYLSSLCPLLLFLTLYSYLLVSLQIDPNAGTHPLVPFLISSEDKSEIWIIIILAVVIAPIVEEIMFRGALYSWMRVHFSPGFSIFCSSLIFAALHPQGLIGVFPLLIIGIVLALLREWRGNLISAIFAHACFNGATLLLLQAFR